MLKKGFYENLGGLAIMALTLVVFAVIACVGDPAYALAVAPVLSFSGFAKKESELSDEEKQTLGTIEKMVNKCLEDYGSNVIDRKEYEETMSEISEKLKSLGSGNNNKEVTEIRDIIKSMGKEIEQMKGRGITLGVDSPLEKSINEFLDSEKFKQYVDGKTKSSGNFHLDLKDVVSMTDSYTGNILISQQQNRVVTQVSEKKINFRNLMSVDQGDPAFPMLTWQLIYDLDRNATFVSENGRLSQSSFKLKEESSEVKRVGTFLYLSKRLLKSRVYVRSWLINRLSSWVRMAEDFQIMFGDGTGDNLKGITKYDGVKCVSDIITDAVVSGEAGSIKGARGYNGGKATIVEFTNPQDKIVDGQKIKIEGVTTFTDLNGTFDIHKMNDREIRVEVAFTASGVFTAATFEVKNNFFNTVASPNLGDAVKAIFGVMTYAEYTPNMIAMNPSTLFEIETLKDTSGRDLNLVTLVNGVKYVAGRPVVETTCIMPGYYFVGDMVNGASLVDYTSINIEFADDIESRLKNQTAVIVDEEVIMPVYNPWAFAYGKLSDVLTAIKKSS